MVLRVKGLLLRVKHLPLRIKPTVLHVKQCIKYSSIFVLRVKRLTLRVKRLGFTRKTLDFARKTFDFTRKTFDFTRKTVIYDTNGLPYACPKCSDTYNLYSEGRIGWNTRPHRTCLKCYKERRNPSMNQNSRNGSVSNNIYAARTEPCTIYHQF